MIKEFTVELSSDEASEIGSLVAGAAVYPPATPGRKTFAFEEDALVAICDGDFERFLWTAFDRVERNGDVITLGKGDAFVFYLPVAKLQDPDIRRSIWDFVTGRVGLNG